MRYLIVLVLVVGVIASIQAASHIACRIECSPADPCPNHQYCQTVGCATHCLPYIGKRFFIDSPCPAIACLMLCQWGQAKDKTGCTVCACADAPKLKPETKVAMSEETAVNKRFLTDCPNFLACNIFCVWGQAVDDKGCTLCACAQGPAVKKRVCPIFCQWGLAKDEHGTRLACQCASPPTDVGKRFLQACPPDLTVCAIVCRAGGQAIDENGCLLCACAHKPPVKKMFVPDPRVALTPETGIALTETKVEKRACLIFCQWGLAKDEHGHFLNCRCALEPTDVGKRFLQVCPLTVCAIIFCPWGQATDDKGCPLCACAFKPVLD